MIPFCNNPQANPNLPFGGVGNSGMGSYHGKWGFDTFSHRRAVVRQSRLVDTGPLRFPPYTDTKLKIVDTLFHRLPDIPNFPWKNIIILGLSVAVAVLSAKVAGKLPNL
jgi:hypothetical protein